MTTPSLLASSILLSTRANAIWAQKKLNNLHLPCWTTSSSPSNLGIRTTVIICRRGHQASHAQRVQQARSANILLQQKQLSSRHSITNFICDRSTSCFFHLPSSTGSTHPIAHRMSATQQRLDRRRQHPPINIRPSGDHLEEQQAQQQKTSTGQQQVLRKPSSTSSAQPSRRHPPQTTHQATFVATFDLDKHQQHCSFLQLIFCNSLVKEWESTKEQSISQLRFLWIQDLHQSWATLAFVNRATTQLTIHKTLAAAPQRHL